MSQFIAIYELDGLNEQELRALYARIISDLRRVGQSAQDCPHISATLRNIEAALLRLQQRPKPRAPKAPGF
ncbi:hypothetical protein [Parerythrobacter lacustris]|uniref:Uncharacterized protein n=1 Tax=Parerythrobacter lacustris TaxID=2969984 RepID=A0ABT1XP23_9SPHN|nr:hypothetical protein [Parerythrobacter lacustris]MCR2832395.1 hypothetical protein [Parerythrobacter lacustris]